MKKLIILAALSLAAGTLSNINFIHVNSNLTSVKNKMISPHERVNTKINQLDCGFFNHGYFAHVDSEHHAQDPSKVDINVNYSEYKDNNDDLKKLILKKLDTRYTKYFQTVISFGKHVSFSDLISCEKVQFHDSKYNSDNVFNDFTLSNLKSLNQFPFSGQWRTFNLKLVNLLNNTSFQFSLNLCHFDLSHYSALKSINLKSKNAKNLPIVNEDYDSQKNYYDGRHSCFWYLFSSVSDDQSHRDIALNLKNVTDFDSNTVLAHFDSGKQAGFFLRPLLYKYKFHVVQRMKSYDVDFNNVPALEINFNATDKIDLAKLQKTSWKDLTTNSNKHTYNTKTTSAPLDMPYNTEPRNYNNVTRSGESFSFKHLNDADHLPSSFHEKYYASYNYGVTSLATAAVAYTEADSPSNVEILHSVISAIDNAQFTHFSEREKNVYLYLNCQSYGENLNTSFNKSIFTELPKPYQFNTNSIVNYYNFWSVLNKNNTKVNMYAYKSDIINDYYTYAIQNSKKPNNTNIKFNSNEVNQVTINGHSTALDSTLNLKNFIIDDKPTLLKIKLTPQTSIISSNLYYGYDSSDKTINFNVIAYPADYKTFYNYIDFNKVVNNAHYNRELKIHIDGSLINFVNNQKIVEDTNLKRGLIQIIDQKSAYNWKNYNGENIKNSLNKDCFNFINRFISNPNSLMKQNRNASYSLGFLYLLEHKKQKNIILDIKFNKFKKDRMYIYTPSDIYNKFSGKNPNKLFYTQIVF